MPHERIRLVHGDTAETPYSTGTWGSRCMIMAGGAVAAACDELASRVLDIGAKLLQAKREEVRLIAGEVVGPSGRIAVADVARTWYRRPQDLPGDVNAGGLEVTAGYKAKRDTGTFSYAAHAAVVAVDPETGELDNLLDYVVVEDGGTLVNPMIVDGQIIGGTAQGIGTALYEEMRFDVQGQPLASTLSDYLLPGPTEVPDVRIVHMETPSPYTRFGQKGLGEAGYRSPGCHHQRRQRRARRPRRRAAGVAHHAPPHRRGDRPRRREGQRRVIVCRAGPAVGFVSSWQNGALSDLVAEEVQQHLACIQPRRHVVAASNDAIKNDRPPGAPCGAFDLDPLRMCAGQYRLLGRLGAAVEAPEEANQALRRPQTVAPDTLAARIRQHLIGGTVDHQNGERLGRLAARAGQFRHCRDEQTDCGETPGIDTCHPQGHDATER